MGSDCPGDEGPAIRRLLDPAAEPGRQAVTVVKDRRLATRIMSGLTRPCSGKLPALPNGRRPVTAASRVVSIRAIGGDVALRESQPDRSRLTSMIAKIILTNYKTDQHP